MAILVYKDDACTALVKSPQYFTQANSVSPFTVFNLTTMGGADLGALYLYDGTNYTKLTQGTNYTLAGSVITLAVGLTVTQALIAVPTDRLNLNFGGVFGAVKTSTSFVILKRETAYTYDSLQLSSEDLNIVPEMFSSVDAAVASLANQSMLDADMQSVTGSKLTCANFIGLTINALIGQAVVLNGEYIGKVIANSATEVLIDKIDLTLTGDDTDDISIFTVSSLKFAVDDGTNTPPSSSSFTPVVNLPNLDVDTPQVKVWLQDTVTIPENATNYPNVTFKLTGIEYLA